jgi:hypothetical protein
LPLIFSACILGLSLGLRAQKRDLQDIAPLLVVWIPWLLLVFIAERTRSERFFWIWSLQVAVLVFAVFQILDAISKNAWLKRAAVLALALLVFPLSFYLPAIRGWIDNGYSGADNPQVQVVDFIHQQVAAEGTDAVSIGYSLLQPQPVDNRMRNGSWFDLLLETRWGLHNLNQNPTGLEDGDTWRILESETPSLTDPSPWQGFVPVAVFGPYIICRLEAEKILHFPIPRLYFHWGEPLIFSILESPNVA